MSTKAHLLVGLGLLILLTTILVMVRRRTLRGKYALLWVTVGIGLVPFVATPGALDWLARTIGVSYKPVLYLLSFIGFLFLLSIHFSFELSRLEERNRTLAEQVALLQERLERVEDNPAD